MKKALFFILFYLFFIQIYAQVINGRLIDSDSKNPVPFVTIKSDNSYFVYSDSSGYFSLNTKKIGRVSISFSRIGYQPQELKNMLTSAGKQTEVYIELKSLILELAEVVVENDSKLSILNTKTLNIDQTNRYSGTWGDPARMAQSFAGVSSVNDESNELVIRGNSPKGLLWTIEGVEVPSPNHFSSEGASGGIISVLNTNTIRNSRFYTSAFPANYGNALSGVFDIRLRTGNKLKRENSININLLGVDLNSEGNFSKKKNGSYLFNYRFTNTKLLREIGVVKALNVATPKFQDITFKINIPMKNQTFSIWGIGGENTSDYSISTFLELKNWSNFFASGINYNRQLNKNSSLESIVSYSGYEYYFERNQKWEDQKESKFSNLAYQFLRISNIFYSKINSKNSFQIGSIVTNNYYKLKGQLGFEFFETPLSILDTELSEKDNTFTIQNHFLWNARFLKNTINFGVNNSIFILNKKFLIEPRFNFSHEFTDRLSLQIGLGLHSRLEPISIYLYKNNQKQNGKDVQNKHLPPSQSFHKSIGISSFVNDKKIKLTIEAYHQNLFSIGVGDSNILPGSGHISILNQLNATRLLPLTPSGKGVNYGLEFTLERDLNKGYYFNYTTSIYRSLFSIDGNNWLPSKFDNRYVLNFLTGKEWQIGENLFNINFRSTWAGGIRNYPLEIVNSVPIYSTTDGFSRSLKDYIRLDLKFNYTLNFHKTTSTFSIDLNNLINRKNPLSEIYNPVSKQIETINQLGFLPMLNYRLNF